MVRGSFAVLPGLLLLELLLVLAARPAVLLLLLPGVLLPRLPLLLLPPCPTTPAVLPARIRDTIALASWLMGLPRAELLLLSLSPWLA